MNKTSIALLTVIGLVTIVMVVFIVLGVQSKANLGACLDTKEAYVDATETCLVNKEACLVNHERFKYGIPLEHASVNSPVELTTSNGDKFRKVGEGKVNGVAGVRFHFEDNTINTKNTDMEECIKLCTEDVACVGISFSHNNNTCRLVNDPTVTGTDVPNISSYTIIRA